MLEPIPFWGMIEVDLPVKTYAGNKANYIREDMNNEPVAWMSSDEPADIREVRVYKHLHHDWIPLYTHPAKTLTDEEIEQLQAEHTEKGHFADTLNVKEFARAILRKAQENG